MNLIHASLCSLVWWLYGNDTAGLMLSFMQESLNICEIKFVSVSEMILLGSQYSEKIILHVLLGCSQ